MEVQVEIGEGLRTTDTPAPASGMPADPSRGQAARQEYADIMSDPRHPMYAGFKRGEKSVMDHIDGLYTKAYAPPDTPSFATPPPDSAQAMTLSVEDRAAASEFDATLRSTFGETYDTTMRDMRAGASHLFSTPDGVKALEFLSQHITGLGPLAEVRAVRFLAEIGQLKQSHT